MSGQIDWIEVINTIINVLLIPILPVLATYVITFLKKKTAEIESGINCAELAKYLNIAENAVITSVTAVNQVYVDALKKSNGSLSPYEQRLAFEMAREKVLNILGDTTITSLKEAFNDFEVWLENKIEYYVNQSKNNPEALKTTRLLPYK